MSACAPSRQIARPHCLGRKRGKAEIDRPPSGAEDDARDVVDDARSRHRVCQGVIVEQRITGGGRPHAGLHHRR